MERVRRPPDVVPSKPLDRPVPAPSPGGSQADQLLDLQATAGNQAVTAMVQRDGAASPGAEAPTPDAVPMYPIFDRPTKQTRMVDAAAYEQERATLARLIRYLIKEIPRDAKEILEGYPFAAVKEMYVEVTEALQHASSYYSKGDLALAGRWAKEATTYSGIEMKAHKLLMEESALSYVGKRVGLAVIGFFEGAADALLGLVDAGAGLIGYHTGLVEWNTKRYETIKGGYTGASGIDHNLVHDDEIGRVGGKVAGGLAIGKGLTQIGAAGQVIMVTQAAAGVKGVVDNVTKLHSEGRTWGEIWTDPGVLAQTAGALAGVAGAGGMAAPEMKQFFDNAGLILTAGQMAGITTKIAFIDQDPALKTDEERYNARLDLLSDLLVTAGMAADAAAGHQPTTPKVTEPAGTTAPAAPSAEHVTAPTGAVPAAPDVATPAVPTSEPAAPAAPKPDVHSKFDTSDVEPAAPAAPKPDVHGKFDTSDATPDAPPPEPAPSSRGDEGPQSATPEEQPADLPAEEKTGEHEQQFDATEEPTGIHKPYRSPGTVRQHVDMLEAFKNFVRWVKTGGGREVALIYNHRLKIWAVVQGSGSKVRFGPLMEQYGWNREDFTMEFHNHPPDKSTGVTSEANLHPSGHQADLDVVEVDANNRAEVDQAMGEPARAQLTTIKVTTERGPERVYVAYDPNRQIWVVDFPLAGASPGRNRLSFRTFYEYHQWFYERFLHEPGSSRILDL